MDQLKSRGVVLDGLTVGYGPGLEVLRGLTATIAPGDFVTIVGGNGAGKSTLLKAIAGEIGLTSGRLWLDGEDISSWSSIRRSGVVAQVVQDPRRGTWASLSIAENFSLAASRGKRRSFGGACTLSMRALLADRLRDIGLQDRLDDPMSDFSGGQRQVMSLLMATMQPCRLLLLDEHTAALDPTMARKVMEWTCRIAEEKRLTILMVTHSMHHALHYGNRTWLLEQGRVAYDWQGSERALLQPKDLLACLES
jgi:putative ABC transport system ATP-binding protein